MVIDKESGEGGINPQLAEKAKKALSWCVEEIGKTHVERGILDPDTQARIEEINALISELAKLIAPENSVALYPVQDLEFTLANGRTFKVKRI